MLKSKLFVCSYIVNLNLETVWWSMVEEEWELQTAVSGPRSGSHVRSCRRGACHFCCSQCTHTSVLDIWEDPPFPCHCFSFALRDGRALSSRDSTGWCEDLKRLSLCPCSLKGLIQKQFMKQRILPCCQSLLSPSENLYPCKSCSCNMPPHNKHMVWERHFCTK